VLRPRAARTTASPRPIGPGAILPWARFRELIERSGLHISEPKIDLLIAIRAMRNHAVHGRPAAAG
jgi:hypothetical protein